MPPASRYTYDERSGRYRSADGRFVPASAIRAELDAVLAREAKAMQALGEQLRARTISVARFELAMRERIKSMQLASAALGKGGWAQMNSASYGRAGQIIRTQYEYLRGMVQDIAAGRQLRDGTLTRRVMLYAQAARPTYEAIRGLEMAVRGFDEERNVLHPADHCAGCLGETARGWVPIGSLVPIGSRDCMVNDHCTTEFRNSTTGQIAA